MSPHAKTPSCVRHRNAILILGIVRRSIMGIYQDGHRRRKNQLQPALRDFYDAINAFHHRLACSTLCLRHR